MLLSDIRDYLRERGSASLQEVALHFDITLDTAKFAMGYWQNKGKIRALSAACSSGCGKQGSCSSSSSAKEQYEWLGRSVPLQFVRPAHFKKSHA